MADEPVTRREFAGRMALGAAIPVFAGSGNTGAAPPAQQPEEKERSSPVDGLLALIRQQYADARLDNAGIAEIREELEVQFARSARLSAFPLTNADEPGFAFRAYRGTEEGR